jgi:Tol biopolymer transport system component
MRRALWFGGLLLLWVGGMGCAGVKLADLPPEPIAFIYRTPDEAKRRAELLDPQAKPGGQRGTGKVVRFKSVRDYVTGATDESELMATAGRMALLDPRGGDVTILPVTRPGARPIGWTGDHAKLIFSALAGRKSQVFTYDLATQVVERVTPGPYSQAWADIGPAGETAFSRISGVGKQAISRIWLREPGGTARRLTEGPSDYRPRFTRDGKALLYSSRLDSGADVIRRLALDTGEDRVIARGADHVVAYDGSMVAYARQFKGLWELWRMNPDGTGKHDLGGRWSAVIETQQYEPALSPDGRYVVYVSMEVGRESLRIRQLDGRGDRPLLEGADGSSPVW